jgi:uncharacterized protein YciI
MTAWTDYRARASERGALALELFIVRSVPQSAPEEIAKALPEHLAYQRELESRGILVMAGPVSNAAGDALSGEGLMIYRAANLAEAARFAADDPMHRLGLKQAELRAWLVNEGQLTVSLTLSRRQGLLA